MKNEITVAEAKRAKKELEESLLAQIKAFEAETECSVKSVDFHCNQSLGGPPEVYALFVECGL